MTPAIMLLLGIGATLSFLAAGVLYHAINAAPEGFEARDGFHALRPIVNPQPTVPLAKSVPRPTSTTAFL